MALGVGAVRELGPLREIATALDAGAVRADRDASLAWFLVSGAALQNERAPLEAVGGASRAGPRRKPPARRLVGKPQRGAIHRFARGSQHEIEVSDPRSGDGVERP